MKTDVSLSAGRNDVFEVDTSNEVKPLSCALLSPNADGRTSADVSPDLGQLSATTLSSVPSSLSGKEQPVRVGSQNILFERDAGVIQPGLQEETIVMPPLYDPACGAVRSDTRAPSGSKENSLPSGSITKSGYSSIP